MGQYFGFLNMWTIVLASKCMELSLKANAYLYIFVHANWFHTVGIQVSGGGVSRIQWCFSVSDCTWP